MTLKRRVLDFRLGNHREIILDFPCSARVTVCKSFGHFRADGEASVSEENYENFSRQELMADQEYEGSTETIQESCEIAIKPEVIEVSYDYLRQAAPCLTHCNSLQFNVDDCFTKGCKWAPDGLCLLTNSNDNVLRVWDLPQNFHSVTQLQRNAEVSPLSPSLSMKEGGLIYDYCWYPLMNSWDPVSCCLASTSRDSPTHLWDAFTGKLRASYRAYNQVDEVEAARSVAFDPNGEKLYCGFKNCVRVFDVSIPGRSCSTRNLKTASEDAQNGIVSCITVSPAIPSLFAVGTYMQTVGLYSEDTGKALCILRGHEGGITHMEFSTDGLRLYSGGRKDSEIVCWDLREPGKVLFAVPRAVKNHQRIYFDLTPDGKYLMSGFEDGKVQIWDTTGTVSDEGILKDVVTVFQAHSDCTNGISVHHQYPLIATSSGQRHYLDADVDFEDGREKTNRASQTSVENSIKLWWMGKINSIDVTEVKEKFIQTIDNKSEDSKQILNHNESSQP